MGLKKGTVAVRTSDSEVWEQVNITYNEERLNEAVDKEKYVKNIVSKSMLGSKIEEIEFNF